MPAIETPPCSHATTATQRRRERTHEAEMRTGCPGTGCRGPQLLRGEQTSRKPRRQKRGIPPGTHEAATSGQPDRHTPERATLTVATSEHPDGLTVENETGREIVTQVPDSAMGKDGPPNTGTLARSRTTRPRKEKKTDPGRSPGERQTTRHPNNDQGRTTRLPDFRED